MPDKLPIEFETLIMEAYARGASDLHLVAGEPPIFRVDGLLQRVEGDPLTAADTQNFAKAVVRQEDLPLRRIGREVSEIHRSFVAGEAAARVCVTCACGEFALAVRLLSSAVPPTNALGVPEGLMAASDSPSGLIIISGRTGSGKYTTACSLLDHINSTRQVNIHTVEDPILYRITPKRSLVQQREVGVDVPDAASAIRMSMYLDPDVVFVSEIANLESLQACIGLAQTGTLVITVVHADSPEEAICRMVDVFPESMREFYRKALSGVLRCVSCQRLIPKATGGRAAAYGVLVPDEEMKSAIAEGCDVLSRRQPLPKNCISTRGEIQRMADEGIISPETAQAYLAEG